MPDLSGKRGWHGVSDLRELPGGSSYENEVIREGLKPCTFSNAQCARDFRVQVRPAASFRPASDDGLGWQCWIKPVHSPKMIALPVVQLHISKHRFRLVLSGLVVGQIRLQAKDATSPN